MAVSSSMTLSAEEPEKQPVTRSHSVSTLFRIIPAFVIVFCPLVLVATLLCLFVTLPIWTIHNPPEENPNLPVLPLNDTGFLTAISINKVTLTSSFAGNIAQFAATPFLLLFSFLVALELANRHQTTGQDVTKLLGGDQSFFFILIRLWRARKIRKANGTKIAGFGALLSFVLTLLLVVGDKLLQGTVDELPQRAYGDNYVDPESIGGFKIDDTLCSLEETIPDIYNDKLDPPCSIDNTTTPWTLYGAPSAYRVLATGLLNQTSDYNKEDFDALRNSSDSGMFNWTQLVTHYDLATDDQHVFLFNPILAEEDSEKQKPSRISLVNNEFGRYGLDYIANTTSIVTRCDPITVDCGMQTTNGTESSIPYHCSDIFNGDLNEIPSNGLERLKGWNTIFYNMEDESPRNISVASQLNPFHYNVTAVVDSINIGGLIDFKDPQALQGNIIGIGNGRVGFAISCTSTVYDVTYSLVDGNIHSFNKTLANPITAAIIKAPLQAGFGSYALFEKATLSVLFSELTVMDSMNLAFSQTFLALASGVYVRAPNLEQRWRADMMLTKLGKGPFYLLVVCMFLYAFVVLVFTVIALSIFRRSEVQEMQVRLIPKE